MLIITIIATPHACAYSRDAKNGSCPLMNNCTHAEKLAAIMSGKKVSQVIMYAWRDEKPSHLLTTNTKAKRDTPGTSANPCANPIINARKKLNCTVDSCVHQRDVYKTNAVIENPIYSGIDMHNNFFNTKQITVMLSATPNKKSARIRSRNDRL